MYKIYVNHKPGFITVKSNNGSETHYNIEEYDLDYHLDRSVFYISKKGTSKRALSYSGGR